ncbi:putative GABA permease [Nemania abortiva]|nr:putative GABA permease [Nemania abortiva]
MSIKSFSEPAVTAHVSEPVTSTSRSRDDLELIRLGKKPTLKRNFGFLAILGFSCTVLVTWEGTLVLFLSGYQNGGPSGTIYGYIIVWAGTLSIFATLSELVSMAPTSGGQYHWVSMLSPSFSRQFLSYLTAWLALTGWQAFVASAAYLTGTLIQGVILLTHPDYAATMQTWQGTLLFWAVVLLSFAINTSAGRTLAQFEGVVLVIHILGFFATILPLTLLGQSTSSEAVWDTWLNLGGWQTQGLSFSIGLLGNVFSFIGADGAIHMSEEIHNAATVLPRSLLIGLMLNGTLGFAMLIAVLYFIGDIEQALAENPLYPFMAILKNGTNSTPGAAAISALIIIMGFSTTTGVLASTSRIYWAFSRDRGLPAWKFFKKVNPKTGIPFNAVVVTTFIAIILSLVNIGGSAAFTGAISISISGLFGSYLIASSLLLYRRLTGGISPYRPIDETDMTDFQVGPKWGPWKLPGLLGVANNTFTCLFLVYILFFSFWPTFRDVTPQNMNWAVLVTVVVLSFSVIYYLLWARHVFKGPIRETGEGIPL